ncbi:MAG TPA: hypothetical protein DD490_05995, partial [Acidobacteria bacterium]|nr:hypothetical protein [Acidobacteriota bacterium]
MNPSFQLLVAGGEAGHFGLAALAGARTDAFVATGAGGAQLVGDRRALAAADQDLVLDEPFQPADRLLEMRLLAGLDLPLIDEQRLLQSVFERLGSSRLHRRSVGRGEVEEPGGERRIDRVSVHHRRGDQPLHRLDPRQRARRIAWLAQRSELDAPFTVAEVLAQAGYAAERTIDIAGIAADCGLDHLLDRPFTALSGGERQ